MNAIRRTIVKFYVAGQDGFPQENAQVTLTLSAATIDPVSGALIMREPQSGQTDSEGRLSIPVWPNGDTGTFYECKIVMPGDQDTRRLHFIDPLVIPDLPEVEYRSVKGLPIQPPLDPSTLAAVRAMEAAQQAREWVESLTEAPTIEEATGLLAFYYVDESGSRRLGYLSLKSLADLIEKFFRIVPAETVIEVEGGVLATLPASAAGMRIRAVTIGQNITCFLAGTQQTDAGVFCPNITMDQVRGEQIYFAGLVL